MKKLGRSTQHNTRNTRSLICTLKYVPDIVAEGINDPHTHIHIHTHPPTHPHTHTHTHTHKHTHTHTLAKKINFYVLYAVI